MTMPPENADTLQEQLDTHIDHHEWEALTNVLKSHPFLCQNRNHRYGWTSLHRLCSIGGTPAEVIASTAALYPAAVVIPDTYMGDTCLHIVARNSQFSSTKLQCLLLHCNPASILIRNYMGGTPLHSAANHNAVLRALQTLVSANPAVVKVATHDGIIAVAALWLAFVQTIPGHMPVVQILNGEKVESAGFSRFWEKVEFLVSMHFRTSNACPETIQDDVLLSSFVIHGLLRFNTPINLLKVSMYHRPKCAQVVDADGNLPLHVLLERRPYRLKEREAIQTCLEVTPWDLVGIPNYAGDVPLNIAIRNKIPIANGVDLLLAASPTSAQSRDVSTGLYPFQLAATQGSSTTIVNLIFCILIHQPDLVHTGLSF